MADGNRTPDALVQVGSFIIIVVDLPHFDLMSMLSVMPILDKKYSRKSIFRNIDNREQKMIVKKTVEHDLGKRTLGIVVIFEKLDVVKGDFADEI